MKPVLLGIIAAALLAGAAWFVTDRFAVDSADRYTSPNDSVRID